MEFPGVLYWRKSTWNLQGLITKGVDFSGVIKKKWCGISRGLAFGLGFSQKFYKILQNFQGWNFVFFSGISRGNFFPFEQPKVITYTVPS